MQLVMLMSDVLIEIVVLINHAEMYYRAVVVMLLNKHDMF